MSNPFYLVRRLIAQEMQLWGGKVDGVSPGPSTFTSVDPQGSLLVVYDSTRPEPDADWNGSYICINPGGTGNSNLSTIWRRIADDNGFINANGSMTLTAALPNANYAVQGMTYELFKMFTPEQWLIATNFAIRNSYPQRHRLIAFEVKEDNETRYYDWAHLAIEQSLTDPVAAPTVSAVGDPGGKTNYWASGVYTVGYNIYNAAGETLVSPTTTVTLSPNQVLEFAAIAVPENAIGVNYWITIDPGGSVLSQLTAQAGLLPDAASDNITPQPGVADRTTLIVPRIRFWGPPYRLDRTTPLFNSSKLDLAGLSLKSMKRRTNPGMSPERYIDLNPGWWREVGGTTVEIYYRPNDHYNLRFECMTPVRALVGESDTTDEPIEVLIAGSMLYLWNTATMTASSQNATVWVAQAKAADVRFQKARNMYQMPGPRKTLRRPFIQVVKWPNWWGW